jgi:signal transduction histidine kinase/ligand-binding sensor domain-containing protein/DNA-binding response OmpR family regulator
MLSLLPHRYILNKSHILICVFFVCFLSVSAQTEHINFTSLTSKDGLLSNSVNAILKDRLGLMWFATDDGLYKFDGTNFTVYRNLPDDSSSIRANEVLALHEDRKGVLWIGTSGGGLSIYNRTRDIFEHIPPHANATGLSRNAVIRGICSDQQGKIWIAQFDGLYVVDPHTKTSSKYNLVTATGTEGTPVHTPLLCILADSKNRIWVGTDSGLFLLNRETNTFTHFRPGKEDPFSLSSSLVKAISEDKSGNIWIGTANGLNRLRPDGAGFTIFRHNSGDAKSLSDNFINCMAADNDGRLWIGTSEGLNIYDSRTGQFTAHTSEYGNVHTLTSKSIKCVYIDRQGIYWFGTFRGGINKYDKNLNLFNLKLSTSFPGNEIDASSVRAFAEHTNGKVFVGTDGRGLYEFDRTTEKIRSIHIPLQKLAGVPLTVLALHISSNNKLYIGTYAHGLIIMDLATGSFEQLKEDPDERGMGSNDIFCIQEDRRGLIWVGTNGTGVKVLDHNKVMARYAPRLKAGVKDSVLPLNGYIRAIEKDTAGNIWIGSHGSGLAVFHPANGRWTVFTQANSQLPSGKVEVLLRDSRGNMWAGTYGGGLTLFDKNKNQFINFSERDGLQNTTIYQILEDLQGQIWVSTNAGISSFNIQTKKFRNFTGYNGIQHNSFLHGSGIRLRNGELLFGGQQGFNYFYPNQLAINRNVPTVIFTDLKISNKSVAAGHDAPIKEHISVANEIRLAYKQNFALGFVALNYTIPRQNHYAYKLDGFDKDWNYTGPINTAAYTNLDPGQYTFRVKASNNDGVWSAGETIIKIYVNPPFWRTTYAYLFYIAAIGGLLLYSRYLGISRLRKKFALEQERQQVKRMQELDRLKLKFLTNLSHDFRTPISLIMGPVDQLIAEEHTSGKVNKLYMIRRNARRLLNLVNQLLDFRKMEEHELKLQLSKGEFISFVKEVAENFRDLSEKKNIRFVFDSEITRLDALFDQDKMERILFNLLSNAFKFTLEGGTIGINITPVQTPPNGENTWVCIKVTDTGIGITPDKKDRIFDRFFQDTSATSILNQGTGIGLSITKEFIKMHGGMIDVESVAGKGCTFMIQIPLTPITGEKPSPVPENTDIPRNNVGQPASAAKILTGAADNLPEAPSILLVEDNEDFRFYLKENLRNGYKVLEAVNGKEGWQKALAHHPQLVVTDINMPEMDGIVLTRKLKGDKRTSHIPVILLTALTNEEQQIAGLETGANDYITKPFNSEVLHAKIRNLLQLNDTLKNTYSKQIRVLSPEVEMESADEKLLNRIVSYLEENLTNSQLSVESLSKEIGMSRSSLYSKLLELTGQTPVEYIRSYRLDKAAMLMEKSDLTIAEIAYQVGFSTPNYFTKAFKSKFNMSPSEFIARVKKDNSNG